MEIADMLMWVLFLYLVPISHLWLILYILSRNYQLWINKYK